MCSSKKTLIHILPALLLWASSSQSLANESCYAEAVGATDNGFTLNTRSLSELVENFHFTATRETVIGKIPKKFLDGDKSQLVKDFPVAPDRALDNLASISNMEIHRADGREYRLPEGSRFSLPAPRDEYRWTVPAGTKIRVADKKARTYAFAGDTNMSIPLPKNYLASLNVAENRIVHRIPESGDFYGTSIDFETIRAPLGEFVTLEINRENFDFANQSFAVCLRKAGGALADFKRSGNVSLQELDGNNNRVRLRAQVPDEGFDAAILGEPVDLLVVMRDRNGKISDVMSHDFKISSQGWALFLTLVSAVLIYLGVVRYKFKKVGKHDPIAFVSGKYGRASLSLLQILLWTLLVFFASVYVWLVSGELLELTDQVLILLGIAGGSSLIAKITASTRDEKGQLATALANDDKRAAAATPETTRTPRWEDLFQTAGRPDLHKVQMAMFTVLALFYALVEIVDSLTFPELPNELLILIGISNGVYIGAKAVGKSDYDKLAEKDRELTQARQALEALKTDRGKAKRSATAAEKAHTAAAAGADKQAKKTSLDEAKEEVTRIEKSIETAEAGLAAKQAEFDELRKKVMG